jgi:hypothetical protein
MLQAKMLKSYKRYTIAAESFDDSLLPASYPAISLMGSPAQLEEWNSACRQKHGLLQRVIQARAEHHQLYYNGGDWGHGVFVETLKSECDRLERFMSALDRRAYAVRRISLEHVKPTVTDFPPIADRFGAERSGMGLDRHQVKLHL